MPLALFAGAYALWDLASYNRKSFFFDNTISQERAFQEQDMRVEQFGLYREDVRDLVELTVGKMDLYLVAAALLVDRTIVMICKQNEAFPTKTPEWAVTLNSMSLASGVFYLLLALWLAMYASISAQSFGARLLTQFVRLPYATKEQLARVTRTAEDFEAQSAHKLLKVPIIGASPGPEAVANGLSRISEAASSLAGTSGRPSDPSSAGLPEQARDTDAGAGWNLLPVEMLEHIQLYRRVQLNWQAYDAYARVCLFIGASSLLYSCLYWCLGQFLQMDGKEGVAPAIGVAVIFASVQILLTRLDLRINRSDTVWIGMLLAATPAFTTTGLLIFTLYDHGKDPTKMPEWVRHVMAVCAVLAHLLHAVVSLCALMAAWPDTSQDGGAMLPNRFKSALYLDVFGWLLNTAARQENDGPPAVRALRRASVLARRFTGSFGSGASDGPGSVLSSAERPQLPGSVLGQPGTFLSEPLLESDEEEEGTDTTTTSSGRQRPQPPQRSPRDVPAMRVLPPLSRSSLVQPSPPSTFGSSGHSGEESQRQPSPPPDRAVQARRSSTRSLNGSWNIPDEGHQDGSNSPRDRQGVAQRVDGRRSIALPPDVQRDLVRAFSTTSAVSPPLPSHPISLGPPPTHTSSATPPMRRRRDSIQSVLSQGMGLSASGQGPPASDNSSFGGHEAVPLDTMIENSAPHPRGSTTFTPMPPSRVSENVEMPGEIPWSAFKTGTMVICFLWICSTVQVFITLVLKDWNEKPEVQEMLSRPPDFLLARAGCAVLGQGNATAEALRPATPSWPEAWGGGSEAFSRQLLAELGSRRLLSAEGACSLSRPLLEVALACRAGRRTEASPRQRQHCLVALLGPSGRSITLCRLERRGVALAASPRASLYLSPGLAPLSGLAAGWPSAASAGALGGLRVYGRDLSGALVAFRPLAARSEDQEQRRWALVPELELERAPSASGQGRATAKGTGYAQDAVQLADASSVASAPLEEEHLFAVGSVLLSMRAHGFADEACVSPGSSLGGATGPPLRRRLASVSSVEVRAWDFVSGRRVRWRRREDVDTEELGAWPVRVLSELCQASDVVGDSVPPATSDFLG
mmetsp:Transcript_4681/g.17644  ORF Transcript_4681/g.17644 Transcript_4681/m.17644 type:complete len:1088 (-) Transcript_4681:49-3312(-)